MYAITNSLNAISVIVKSKLLCISLMINYKGPLLFSSLKIDLFVFFREEFCS